MMLTNLSNASPGVLLARPIGGPAFPVFILSVKVGLIKIPVTLFPDEKFKNSSIYILCSARYGHGAVSKV